MEELSLLARPELLHITFQITFLVEVLCSFARIELLLHHK